MANLDAKYAVENRSQAFADYGDGTLVSVAGPGAGKTTSLLRRIEALKQRGEPIDSICYLTFIKEICSAFNDDYVEKFGLVEYDQSKPRVSTLHSFACRLLRERGFQIHLEGELNFLSLTDKDDPASRVILSDAVVVTSDTTVNTAARLRMRLDEAKASWRDCSDPDQLSPATKQVLPRVLELLRAYRLVDWDQTIVLAHELLQKLITWPNWISQVNHFLVDEYQDFNRAEQLFITRLISHARSTVIVGDHNQSLYSGRGGSPEGLRALWSKPTSDQVSLGLCWRSRSRIVEVANFFAAATLKNPMLMQPHKSGGEVLAYTFKSSKAELTFLKQFLAKTLAALPQKPERKDGIVCLFPTKDALGRYYEVLSPEFKCSRRKQPPNQTRISVERCFRLIAHPNQRFLERLILDQFAGISPRHKKVMVQAILERDISPTGAIEALISQDILKKAAANEADEFLRLCGALSSADASLIADTMSPRLGHDPAHIRACIEQFVESLRTTDEDQALRRACDALLPESALPAEDPSTILFLTIHGAKGLTKKTVVMPGLEAAWLPGDAAGEALQERRRMFYVALTRATDTVLITTPRTRAQKDPLNYATPGRGEPSPFVAEAGVESTYHV